MDLKYQSQVNRGKSADVSKYNLRCNRSLSEKMTKKDFIYDIRRPLQAANKVEQARIITVNIPEHLRQSKIPKITIRSPIAKNHYIEAGGDATMNYSVHRISNFECNFCHEQIATLFSLSTHVKSHHRKYCKMCYWILDDGEMMENHFIKKHSGLLTAIPTIPARSDN
ncbi:uncharacterized protein [Venturia canescens]|uniref:uncharacterized protein n=1 Tax=Venturia canescens TaxID=32260 RepID=UPI001C9C28F8|nr:uncharacterized protein LOC122411522 [Venturia canescens]